MTDPTPHYGHQPVQMRRVNSFGDIDNAGDFIWETVDGVRRIVLALPRPRDGVADDYVIINLPISADGATSPPVWKWDGNEDAPTLDPSINCIGHWHGWVRAGKMVEA